MSSVTLQKVTRLWRTGGAGAVWTRGVKQLNGWAKARFAMRRRPKFESIPELLDYGFERNNGCLRPLQVRSEIQGLLELLDERKPKRMLEIGTANGGTLFLFSRVISPDAHLVSLDLPGGDFGEGYPVWKIPLYRSFAMPGQRIDLIRGNSHDPDMPGRVSSIMGNQKLDFLFIDGDHTYDGVKCDFEMFSPLVEKGGVVAFHDIAQHQSDDCQVTRYWDELKAQYPHKEFVEAGGRGWGGIGVLFL